MGAEPSSCDRSCLAATDWSYLLICARFPLGNRHGGRGGDRSARGRSRGRERAVRFIPLSQSRFSSLCVLCGDKTLSSEMEGIVTLLAFFRFIPPEPILQNCRGIPTFQTGPNFVVCNTVRLSIPLVVYMDVDICTNQDRMLSQCPRYRPRARTVHACGRT
jgi:hypothetical protein